MIATPAVAFVGLNALTIDVEEYFQTPAFAIRHPQVDKESVACRSEGNIDRWLALLAEHDARATFFVLGWLAERIPDAVRRIVANGHELSSYGYQRMPVAEQGDGPFLADIRLAKAVLEDISGVEVKGFRAPGYGIGVMNAWAFDCMLAAGYRYNSNAFPPSQGNPPLPGSGGVAREVRPGLLDVPMAEFRALGLNLRVGGGDAFRVMPYWLSRRLLQSVQAREQGGTAFHVRSWEVDPGPLHQAAGRVPSVDLDVGPKVPEVGPQLDLDVGPEVPEVAPQLDLDVGPEVPEVHQVGPKLDLDVGYPIPMEPRIRRLLTDFRWDRVDHIFL